jgi:hypothetical protein
VVRILEGAQRELGVKELFVVALQIESVALLQRLGFVADLVGALWPKAVRAELRSRIPRSARAGEDGGGDQGRRRGLEADLLRTEVSQPVRVHRRPRFGG